MSVYIRSFGEKKFSFRYCFADTWSDCLTHKSIDMLVNHRGFTGKWYNPTESHKAAVYRYMEWMKEVFQCNVEIDYGAQLLSSLESYDTRELKNNDDFNKEGDLITMSVRIYWTDPDVVSSKMFVAANYLRFITSEFQSHRGGDGLPDVSPRELLARCFMDGFIALGNCLHLPIHDFQELIDELDLSDTAPKVNQQLGEAFHDFALTELKSRNWRQKGFREKEHRSFVYAKEFRGFYKEWAKS